MCKKNALSPALKDLNKLINKTRYIFRVSPNGYREEVVKLVYRAFRDNPITFKIYDLSYIVKNDDDTVQVIYDNDDTGPVKRGILTFSLKKISEAYKHSRKHTPFYNKYRIVSLNSNMNNKYIFIIPRFNLFKNKKNEEREVSDMIENIYWH